METPEEQQGQDAAELSDEEAEATIPATQGGDPAPEADPTEVEPGETEPKPVDNPDLPEDGDPDDFYEEQVDDGSFDQYADNNKTMDNVEEREEPNDLSGIDKEFEDDE